MRILLLLLFPLAAMAQVAQVPPAAVTGTAAIQSQSASCRVPKNGGTCSFNFPSYQAPVTGTTATVTAPVSLKGTNGTITLDFSKSTATKNSDGTTSISGVIVTMVTK